MAAVNEAYRVLRDPGRRAAYDAELAGRGPRTRFARGPRSRRQGAARAASRTGSRPAIRGSSSCGRRRVGAAVVLAAAALSGTERPAAPDNVLEPGSCVAIEANDDAREVTCAGDADDLVVDRVVPLDGVCPVGLSAYRDRQGSATPAWQAAGPRPRPNGSHDPGFGLA